METPSRSHDPIVVIEPLATIPSYSGPGRRLTKAQQKQMEPITQEIEVPPEPSPSVTQPPKRGRPRKYPLITDQLQDVERSVESPKGETTLEVVAKEPKKRGRPRKSETQPVAHPVKVVEKIKSEETDSGSTSSSSNSSSPSNRRISNRLKKQISGKILFYWNFLKLF